MEKKRKRVNNAKRLMRNEDFFIEIIKIILN
jgi:hypothetical protein